MSSAKGRYYEWYIDETVVREQDWPKVLFSLLTITPSTTQKYFHADVVTRLIFVPGWASQMSREARAFEAPDIITKLRYMKQNTTPESKT
jgi:hypothetical protein